MFTNTNMLMGANDDFFEGSCYYIYFLDKDQKDIINSYKDKIVKKIEIEILTNNFLKASIPSFPLKKESILNLIPLKENSRFSFNKLFQLCKKIGEFGRQIYTISKLDNNNIKLKLTISRVIAPVYFTPLFSEFNFNSYRPFYSFSISAFSKRELIGDLTAFLIKIQYLNLLELNKKYIGVQASFDHVINHNWNFIGSFSKAPHKYITYNFLKSTNKYFASEYLIENTYSIIGLAKYSSTYKHTIRFGFDVSLSFFDAYLNINTVNHYASNSGIFTDIYMKQFQQIMSLKSLSPYLIFSYSYVNYYTLLKPILFHFRFNITPSIKYAPYDFLLSIFNPSLITFLNFKSFLNIGSRNFIIENSIFIKSEILSNSYQKFNLKIAGHLKDIVFGKHFYNYKLTFNYIFYRKEYKYKSSNIYLQAVSIGLFYLIDIGNAWDALHYFSHIFDEVFIGNAVGLRITLGKRFSLFIGMNFPLYPMYKNYGFYFKITSYHIDEEYYLRNLHFK